MSILIKGIDMPTDEGIILALYNGKAKQVGTEKEYEAVEVPPHGRLIDADEAVKAIEDLPDCPNGFSDTYDKACIVGVIEEIPTIIGAEENK